MTATQQLTEPMSIREQVVRFGSDEQLVGIVTRPTSAAATAVTILNAGVLHRIGPHRLHVTLARRLAERGFLTLRLDLGGIGDSVPSSDAATFRESAIADTRLAIGALEPRRHVIFGICAGADNAMATALVDDRIAGIVLIDPHAYANRRAFVRALRVKLGRQGPRAALRWGAGRVAREVQRRLALLRDRNKPPAPAEGREPPTAERFRMQLEAIAERGVKVLAVYSGAHGPGYNHEDQLFEVFPELRGKIDRAYFPNANHTFTELAQQAHLIDAVTDWIATRFR
jgi:pimeloyl-ACP methyl ester carboxylesterase